MRVSVIIPTTNGPAQLLRLAPLHNAPRSVMRTQDDYRPLPVSAAYQAFSTPGGPMDMAFGLKASAFDLRLSARVDSGRSWELPVALAHWLQAQGHELCAEAPDLVVWATGALDLDMGVIAQEYHLPSKLSHSRDLLNAAAAEGQQVVVFLPGSNAPPAGLSGTIALHKVTSFAQAIGALHPCLARVSPQAAAPEASASPTHHGRWHGRASAALLGVAGLALTAVLAFFGPWDWPGWNGRVQAPAASTGPAAPAAANDTAETDTEARPEPSADADRADEQDLAANAKPVMPALLLLRPDAETSCINVHFGGAEAQQERPAATEDGFEHASLERLCAVGLALPEEAAAALHVTLPETLLPHVMPSDRIAEMTLAPGEERVFALTAQLPDRLDLRWLITDEAGQIHALEHSLRSHD